MDMLARRLTPSNLTASLRKKIRLGRGKIRRHQNKNLKKMKNDEKIL